MVIGDGNAVVGEDGNEKCVGKYGLGQRNQRGEKLVEFCNQQQLMITNTIFETTKEEGMCGRLLVTLKDTKLIIFW